MKLYKAVDKIDNTESMFLLYEDGKVAVSYWGELPDAEEVGLAKRCAEGYLRDPTERFKDAIDPVLIAEW